MKRHPSFPPDLPGNSIYVIARLVFRVFYRLIGKLEAHGTENIPKYGPVIFAANHNSHLDPPLVGTDIERITWFMSKEELFDYPVFGWFMVHFHGFPVKRHTADRAALKKALKLLESGETVTIFPEGERSRDGLLKPAEAGVGMIALRSRAPVIPVAITGTRDIFPPGAKKMKPGKIVLTYGKPLDLSDLYERKDARAAMEEASDRIMQALADMLGVPPPVKEDRETHAAEPQPAR